MSRSTTGCVSACLFREFQLSASYEGLIETVPGVNLELLRMDKYELEKDKDALFRGEFEVVKELVAALGDNGQVSLIWVAFSLHSYQFFFRADLESSREQNFFSKIAGFLKNGCFHY